MAHPGASARSAASNTTTTRGSSTSGLGASRDRREKRRRTGPTAFTSTPGDARLPAAVLAVSGGQVPGLLRFSPLVQGGAALARFAAERGIDVQFAGDSFIPQRDSPDVLLRRRALGSAKVAQRSARLSTIGSGPSAGLAQSRGSSKRRRQRSGRTSTINTGVVLG